MKKLLLTLGFLPVLAFSNVAENSLPKQALIEELTKWASDTYKQNFPEKRYQEVSKSYQTFYAESNKSQLCYETMQALKNGLEFQHSLDYDKIKIAVITPNVNKLSNNQAKKILVEFRSNGNGKVSSDTLDLLENIAKTISNHSVYKGKVYTQKDGMTNCPLAN